MRQNRRISDHSATNRKWVSYPKIKSGGKFLMNKKRFVLALVFLLISPLMLLSQEQSKEKKIWEDKRIGISLDKLARVDSYPSEFSSSGHKYPSPKEDYDFVVIHVTITRIKDVHLGMPEPSSTTKPILNDAQGKIYELANLQYTGVEFREGLKGDYEIIQGAKGIFLFEFPKNEDPIIFRFAYPYWESWDEKIINYGQIDIKLLNKQ
jgi:hypothetical protein